jgi:L-ascorbate metabolism protein UlaG (beta-lactamase superfamily)
MSRRTACLRAAVLAAGLASRLASPGWSQQGVDTAFLRGDANLDGEMDLSDAVQMLLCMFAGGPCSGCADATDANDDGLRDVSDPVYLLGFLFVGGLPPPAPGVTCGVDPTADDLDCLSFPLCASEDSIPTSRGELLVIPVEHASLALRWDGKTIYVDPVGGASKYADLPAPDVVFVTHSHSDHMDAATLKAVVQESTVLVIPQDVSSALASSGVLEMVEDKVMANGETIQVGDIKVEAVPMYNTTADRLRYHAKGAGNGYVLDLDGTRVYVAGDTEDIPEMRALQDIALAFLPMNLPYTMTPEQAASAVLEFLPRVVYPYHYRGQDQNPETFKSLVEATTDAVAVRLRNWYP